MNDTWIKLRRFSRWFFNASPTWFDTEVDVPARAKVPAGYQSRLSASSMPSVERSATVSPHLPERRARHR